MIKRISEYLPLIVFIAIFFMIFFLIRQNKKVVTVNNLRLFNEFVMTREFIKKGDKALIQQRKKIDSLYSHLQIVSDENSKSNILQEIISQKEIMEEFQNTYPLRNSENIWKRINTYAKDFSIKNNYDILQGVNPELGVFYSDSESDVTDELLIYINKRYEGFN